ncbi:hypothetical protein TNCT_435351 [Trichonephila clavata]|uniref:Uncharacterized protein n=1 Tax=Trichonephila clavata TaxID=2740835 RepID=A0A8X6HPW3_TRICU|nr:hypothetical protein TNCT_435351 [Trichonephila clavata]
MEDPSHRLRERYAIRDAPGNREISSLVRLSCPTAVDSRCRVQLLLTHVIRLWKILYIDFENVTQFDDAPGNRGISSLVRLSCPTAVDSCNKIMEDPLHRLRERYAIRRRSWKS